MSNPYILNNRIVTSLHHSRSLAKEAGLTLVELMISITLGLFIIAAGLSLFLSSKSTYVAGDDTSRLLDSGRFAMEMISRSVRQGGYENLDTIGVPIVYDSKSTPTNPNIQGFDHHTYNIAPSGSTIPVDVGTNDSDVLQVRFFGSSRPAETNVSPDGTLNADGTVLDCAGKAIGAVPTTGAADAKRGWSIFFVNNSGAEPELRCGTVDAAGNLNSLQVATGVESFQVLYGMDVGAPNPDLNGDNIPSRFVSATAVGTDWDKVVAVKISLLMRGGIVNRADSENQTTYRLFGPEYAGTGDPGTVIEEKNLKKGRIRKIFSTVIQLRNSVAGGSVKAL
jgi:type IV pilus assembly protein PilW